MAEQNQQWEYRVGWYTAGKETEKSTQERVERRMAGYAEQGYELVSGAATTVPIGGNFWAVKYVTYWRRPVAS